MTETFEPTIIGFTCNWCSYRAADLAGTARMKYAPNVRLIRMITGCHPGECHYMEQNYKALRRFLLLRRVLKGLGIEPDRVKLVWASAAEGARLCARSRRSQTSYFNRAMFQYWRERLNAWPAPSGCCSKVTGE